MATELPTDVNQASDTMSYSKRTAGDGMANPHEDGWMVTPRAITTIAAIIAILYSLQAPVRYVLALANSVDALTGRVAALEAIAAHEAGGQPLGRLQVDVTRGRDAPAR